MSDFTTITAEEKKYILTLLKEMKDAFSDIEYIKRRTKLITKILSK